MKNNKKTVIFDTDNPELLNNNIFNTEISSRISHTLLPVCFLYKEAQKNNIHFVTPDIYLKSPESFPNALLITHLKTYFTNKLIKLKVKPIVLLCQESPLIATRFYTLLFKYTRKFKHSFMFSGMKKCISKKSIYHQMCFPQPYSLKDFDPINFKDKQMLVLVSRAKFQKATWKTLLIKILYGLSIRNTRKDKLNIIRYFSNKEILDIYGQGWDILLRKQNNNFFKKIIFKGTVENKLSTLKKYKFTLCIENSIFPGYITEKIFDAMFAGSIPVYYGAPDIKDTIPEETFLDIRDFKNYNDLYEYISGMDEDIYNLYIKNIQNYLSSKDYHKFSREYFSQTMLEILDSEFKINE